MTLLDDFELLIVETSGDIALAIAARNFLENALDDGILTQADIPHLTLHYLPED